MIQQLKKIPNSEFWKMQSENIKVIFRIFKSIQSKKLPLPELKDF